MNDSSISDNPLPIRTFAELIANEGQIVKRIAGTLNGGNLFLAHPFQCLEDLGVQLSVDLKKELINKDPVLGTLSLTAYNVIKQQASSQSIQVRVHGLFRRG